MRLTDKEVNGTVASEEMGIRGGGGGHQVGISFHLLTKGTSFDIFTNISAKSRPPKIPFNKFFSLKTTRMTRHGMVMQAAK